MVFPITSKEWFQWRSHAVWSDPGRQLSDHHSVHLSSLPLNSCAQAQPIPWWLLIWGQRGLFLFQREGCGWAVFTGGSSGCSVCTGWGDSSHPKVISWGPLISEVWHNSRERKTLPGGILGEGLSLPTETHGTAKQTPGISGDDLHPKQTHVGVCACACVCTQGETAASINMPCATQQWRW